MTVLALKCKPFTALFSSIEKAKQTGLMLQITPFNVSITIKTYWKIGEMTLKEPFAQNDKTLNSTGGTKLSAKSYWYLFKHQPWHWYNVSHTIAT